jgi:thiol-disulfide isomerase/thioredoxin
MGRISRFLANPTVVKIRKYGSSLLIGIILLILIIPSWRVSFLGWYQGLFASEIELKISQNEVVPIEYWEWEIIQTNGQGFHVKSLYNRPAVIAFWATWCPSCRVELAEMKELQTIYPDDFYFLAVTEESTEVIQNSGLDKKYDFLYSTNKFPDFFEIKSYPTLCIITSYGYLIFKHEGAGELNNKKNIQFLNSLIENQ